MDSGENFAAKTKLLKGKSDQLNEIVNELEGLGVLVNENLSKFRQDIQDILYFYRADYKFSFLIQGEMNAGKSTCLNALLGQRILAVSSVPETNFVTCVVYDRESDIPSLYRTTLSKIYNSETSSFHITSESLEPTGVSGTENIYSHLNGSNQNSRKKLKEFEEKLAKKEDSSESIKQELYKDAKMDDTVYVIKCRITSFEEKIKDEFILKRIQLIDFPGMFEYGQNKITEIYKIFEDNTQGLINILHPLGYESNVITKLQNLEKYPNRLLTMINKMDQINLDVEEGDEDEYNIEKKAEQLVENLQTSLRKISKSSSNNELQKSKYLQMSQDAPSIVHFVTGKEEMMNTYLTKYHNSTNQDEKDLYDSVLKSFAEDDQTYKPDLKTAKKKNLPFAEMECFDNFEDSRNNLFDNIKNSLTEKFRCRFNELVNIEYPKKMNLVRERLIEFIDKMMKNGGDEAKRNNCVHLMHQCSGCAMNPIVGVRYHCEVCEDFDYCENCKGTNEHPEHEFQVISNVEFKDQIKNICLKQINLLVRGFVAYHTDFVAQLKELHSALAEHYTNSKTQELLEDLLKNHNAVYIKYKREREAYFKERILGINLSFESAYSKLEIGQDIVARLLFSDSLDLMKSFVKKFKGICSLLFASCANLMQHIILVTLKNSLPILRQELYDDVDLNAIMLTSQYNSEAAVNDLDDLSTQSRMWLAKFELIYSSLSDDFLAYSKTMIDKINMTMNLGDKLRVNLKGGDEKQKELNVKLGKVLQKVQEIEPL